MYARKSISASTKAPSTIQLIVIKLAGVGGSWHGLPDYEFIPLSILLLLHTYLLDISFKYRCYIYVRANFTYFFIRMRVESTNCVATDFLSTILLDFWYVCMCVLIFTYARIHSWMYVYISLYPIHI